jgi:hypothetical protein
MNFNSTKRVIVEIAILRTLVALLQVSIVNSKTSPAKNTIVKIEPKIRNDLKFFSEFKSRIALSSLCFLLLVGNSTYLSLFQSTLIIFGKYISSFLISLPKSPLFTL